MIVFHPNCALASEALQYKVLNALPEVPTLVVFVKDLEHNGFNAILRLPLKSKQDALAWVKKFEAKTSTNYTVDGTYSENTQKIVFKKRYRCHHNTRASFSCSKTKQPHKKHTNCMARLNVTVKQPIMKRSKDQHLKDYPCKIEIQFCHNHEIQTADVMRHLRPTEEIENIMTEYFANGHTPSSALEAYKLKLQTKYPEDYDKILADGSKFPTQKWCFDLYHKLLKKPYKIDKNKVLILQNSIKEYNECCRAQCAALKVKSSDLSVALCTPLMQRAYKLKWAQECIYVDTPVSNKEHCRIFIFLCPSDVGALPLGIVYTFSNSKSAIIEGIKLLLNLNNSKLAPKVILMDDVLDLKQCLTTYFPQSHLFVSKFHMLQAVWQFLWNDQNGINDDDRLVLYNLFQVTLGSKSESEFSEQFQRMIVACENYPNYIEFLSTFQEKGSGWVEFASCNLLPEKYQFETGKFLRDKIIRQTKIFNPIQLFDFLTNDYEDYHMQRISDIINIQGTMKIKYVTQEYKVKNVVCSKIADDLFKVTTNDQNYYINSQLEICTCSTNQECKHQMAVAQIYDLFAEEFAPINDETMRELYFYIATGSGSKEICEKINENTNEEEIYEIIKADEVNEENSNDTIIAKLEDAFTYLKNQLSKDKELFKGPLQEFAETCLNIKSNSALVAALHSFGKFEEIEQSNIKEMEVFIEDHPYSKRKATDYEESLRKKMASNDTFEFCLIVEDS